MIQTILGFLGYCKIPKEAIQLSMASENIIGMLFKQAIEKSCGQETIDYVEIALNGQKTLTEFLRTGKLLQ